MLIDYVLGQTSIILRVKVRDASASTGAGKTGLVNNSAGLLISTIADNEAVPTVYSTSSSTIDPIATLGSFVAPISGHCRFREVDSVNHKGVYEIQLENARFNVAGSKSLLISISGAANASDCDICIPLRAVNPYSSNGFISGIGGQSPPNNWSLTGIDSNGRITVGTNLDKSGYSITQLFPTNFGVMNIDVAGKVTVGTNTDKTGYVLTQAFPSNFASLSIDSSGRVDIGKIKGTASVGAPGYVGLDWSSITNSSSAVVLSATTIGTVTSLINAASNGDLTLAMKTSVANSVPSAAQIASSVMTDVTDLVGADIVSIKTQTDKLGFDASNNVNSTPRTPVIVATNNDKSGYSITGNVTVGSYATGQDPGTYLASQGITPARASAIDYLDVPISSRLASQAFVVPPSVGSIAAAVLANPTNRLSTDSSGGVSVNMSQPIPVSNTAQTVGDALNAARAQGFGQWLLDPNSRTLKLFAPDGLTVVRTFTLDSVTVPTART
jgi:hypothetical protein